MKILLAVALALSPVTATHSETSGDTSISVHRGIQYATAARQQPPKLVDSVRETGELKVCPQFRDNVSEEYPDDKQVYLDEDCLQLNVWAPRTGGRHPVMVFFHGGAARFGTANEPRYDGSELARKGTVVVTANYRLGLLGAGNNFLRDQMAALEWVQRHIGPFGGDPRNVTAAGESEGAFAISAMLATDNPQRLFRRVILQSGSGYMTHATPTPAADLTGLSTLEVLRLQAKMVGENAMSGAIYFGPYIDGTLVKRPVIDALRAGNARGIDLLVGSNRDEMRFFAQFNPGAPDLTIDEYRPFFPRELDFDQVSRPYRGEPNVALAMLTDQTMRVPAIRMAEAQRRWAKAYVYQFDWGPAVHTAELPFVFGTMSFTGVPGGQRAYDANPRAAKELSNQMQRAWTSFVRDGNPGWPQYLLRMTRIWDTQPRIAIAPEDAQRAAWDAYDFAALRIASS
nr:carboxylesterase family protein [Kibdelosporangium sp. MJ126-NF4]CEL16124.1 putative carboxylesterase type B [Kibdelosporangium sp. MJ126-NF4]CTQ94050.1 putative carboxylesterase type B [Kibdelosporangium sp. MJ126-NF4]